MLPQQNVMLEFRRETEHAWRRERRAEFEQNPRRPLGTQQISTAHFCRLWMHEFSGDC